MSIGDEPQVTVYNVSTCTTCRKLAKLLEEKGVDFDRVEYHVTGLQEAEIRELLAKAGLGPRDVLREREVKARGLDADALSDDELIAAMVDNPALMERPIVVRGDRAVLARPIERVLELFS